jgi:hypothetical protein
LADVERVAVIGDVHADWPALSAVADQIAVAEITGLGAWALGRCEIGSVGRIGGFLGPSAGLGAMSWGDPSPKPGSPRLGYVA